MDEEHITTIHALVRNLHALADSCSLTDEERAAAEAVLWLVTALWDELPDESTIMDRLAGAFERFQLRSKLRAWSQLDPEEVVIRAQQHLASSSAAASSEGAGDQGQDSDRDELTYRCRRCGSRPGIRCTTDGGNFTRPHKKRRNDAAKGLRRRDSTLM